MSRSLLGLNAVLCFLSFVVVYASVELNNSTGVSDTLLRNARVESQRLQQSIGILEKDEYQELIGNLDSDLNELKISVAEFMSNEHLRTGASDVSYQFDDRQRHLLPNNVFPIHIFRLDLNFKVDNAMALADFLQATKDTMTPWPAEVRACDIHRLVVIKLMVHCVLDIYYWGLYD